MKSLIKNQKQKNQKQEKEQQQQVTNEARQSQTDSGDQDLFIGNSSEHVRKSQKRKAKALTVDQLRSFPGLENLTDAMAWEIIAGLEAFAQLTFNQYTSRYGQL